MSRRYLNDDENIGFSEGKSWLRLEVTPLAKRVRVGADGEIKLSSNQCRQLARWLNNAVSDMESQGDE